MFLVYLGWLVCAHADLYVFASLAFDRALMAKFWY